MAWTIEYAESAKRELKKLDKPVAAAYYYESTLDHDEVILIGDFGGGTSDFSLIRIAGDAFDARIIRHVVSPELGMGSQLRSILCSLALERIPRMWTWCFSPEAPRLSRRCARIFEDRFGSGRIRGGNEFASVARGLALNSRKLQERRSA